MGNAMSATQELLYAQREASNLEHFTNWKSWLPYITPIGCAYVNGEPRRYYKQKNGNRYFYRVVAECELHRGH